MADEDNSDQRKKEQEITPYRFRQKEEGLGQRAGRFAGVISSNKKTLAIALGVIILIIVGGTLTGNMIKKSSELKKCQGSLEESYTHAAELSGNITSLESAMETMSANLNKAEEQNAQCTEEYSSCTEEKGKVSKERQVVSLELADKTDSLKKTQKDLNSCTGDLEKAVEDRDTAVQEKETVLTDKEQVEKKYAKYKCCAFYEEGYKYYTAEEGEIKCCYKDGDSYNCGFGPAEKETPAESINSLGC